MKYFFIVSYRIYDTKLSMLKPQNHKTQILMNYMLKRDRKMIHGIKRTRKALTNEKKNTFNSVWLWSFRNDWNVSKKKSI
jgi:hypothetical protein